MDRDANYVAVGAFVLLVIAMAVSFVFWYTDQQDKRTYQRYEIYFPGSVSGLTAGSPVRYLGVDVGKVVRIMLDPQQRKTVQVIVDIDSTAPIDDRTRASLSLQGVTGLLFVDLEAGSEGRVHRRSGAGPTLPDDSLAALRLRRAAEQSAGIDHSPGGIGGSFQSDFQRRECALASRPRSRTPGSPASVLPDTVREAQQLLVEVAPHDPGSAGHGRASCRGLITRGLAGSRGGVRQYPPDFRQSRENHARD